MGRKIEGGGVREEGVKKRLKFWGKRPLKGGLRTWRRRMIVAWKKNLGLWNYPCWSEEEKEQQKEKWEKRRSMESRKRGQMIGEKRDRVKQSNKVFEALRGLVIDTQIQLLICLFFRIKSSSSFKQMVLIKCNLLFQIWYFDSCFYLSALAI